MATGTDERPEHEELLLPPTEAKRLVMRTRRKAFRVHANMSLTVDKEAEAGSRWTWDKLISIPVSQRVLADLLDDIEASNQHRLEAGKEALRVRVHVYDHVVFVS